MKPLSVALALLLAGCATSRAVFSETITSADGVTTTTSLELTGRATLGSKLQEGSGSVAYTFGDSLLEVGNKTAGAESASPAEVLRALAVLAPLLAQLAPLLAPPVETAQGEME